MKNFIMEEEIRFITNRKTRAIVEEAVSSFNEKNYRSAVVVIYTAVIYDLLNKLIFLCEIYQDNRAKTILDEIRNEQKSHPRDSHWETKLIEEACQKTHLITNVEKEDLLHLKAERNYAAHPIINIEDDNSDLRLKEITKETAKDLIRKAFEIVFLRDAILGRDLIEDILTDANEFFSRYQKEGLKNRLINRYFKLMNQESKDKLFKALWKFNFILDNEECNKNRTSNYEVLKILYEERKEHYIQLIQDNEGYYFNLTLETLQIWHENRNDQNLDSNLEMFKEQARSYSLIKFLANDYTIASTLKNSSKTNVFQDVKLCVNHMFMDDDVIDKPLWKIGKSEEKSELFKEQAKVLVKAGFLEPDLNSLFKKILTMISNYSSTRTNWFEPDNYALLENNDLKLLRNQADSRGYLEEYLSFLIDYCTGACTFIQADFLFGFMMEEKKLFKEQHYYQILSKMDDNNQFYSNRHLQNFLDFLEKEYQERFAGELITTIKQKYLYFNLFNDVKQEEIDNWNNVMEIIETRETACSESFLERVAIRLQKDTSSIISDGKCEKLKRFVSTYYPSD